MSVNFQQVREQINRLGELAPQQVQQIRDLRATARDLMAHGAIDLEYLHAKVIKLVQNYDPNLRCALPTRDSGGSLISLDGRFPLPLLPQTATIIAVDGSQIPLNRDSEIPYGLINVGTIRLQHGAPDSPVTTTTSKLIYGSEALDLNDTILALRRDLREREVLAELARDAPTPIITFTDGQLELWGASDPQNTSHFKRSLEVYLDTLRTLENLDVITAGYVDQPTTTLVVRLLEIARLPENEYNHIKDHKPLRGLMDTDLFKEILEPGERSAVFSMQARSSQYYTKGLALHFFYLNTGRPGKPWPVRVEIPGWVAKNADMLDALHATLIHQSKIMGSHAYPYLLHRAHEAAVVSLEEKAQVAQMINHELARQNLAPGQASYKQGAKDLPGRTAYERSRKR